MSSSIRIPGPLPSTEEEDAKKLRKSFQGLGTDEKTIIQILGHRNAHQRSEIRRYYRILYSELLVDRLRSELSGDFGRAVELWTLDPVERDAKLANEALKKKGHRHVWVIIEIACASSPDHLMAVREAYCFLFSSSLEEDIASHFAQQQPLRQFLIRLVSSYRYGGILVDEELARSEAGKLYDAFGKKQLHSEEIVRIIGTRNKSQLKATFQHYKEHYGKAYDEDIKGKCSGNDKFASMLKVAVWCIESPEKHFAEVVRTSIVGLGTDEESLTRVIVSRAEIDMMAIKEEYKIKYRISLKDDVIGDTSGYYMDFLLALLGEDKA